MHSKYLGTWAHFLIIFMSHTAADICHFTSHHVIKWTIFQCIEVYQELSSIYYDWWTTFKRTGSAVRTSTHYTKLRCVWNPTSLNCLSPACRACDFVYIDYVRRSRSSSCRLLRSINCQTYITLHYMPLLTNLENQIVGYSFYRASAHWRAILILILQAIMRPPRGRST